MKKSVPQLLQLLEPLKKKIADRLKDRAIMKKHRALVREFERDFEREFIIQVRGGCYPNPPTFPDHGRDRFILDHPCVPPKYRPGGDIDVDKARAAWKADIDAGIYAPDYYYVSEEFYTEEKKKKVAAEHAAAQAGGGSKAQADKSFWPFSLF